jgi:hypothetical protein
MCTDCCPNPFWLLSKTFFDKSIARSRRFQSSPPSANQTVELASPPLRQDLLVRNVLMTAQRDFYVWATARVDLLPTDLFTNNRIDPKSIYKDHLGQMGFYIV